MTTNDARCGRNDKQPIDVQESDGVRDDAIVDWVTACRLVGDNEDLLRELAREFLREAPVLMAELRDGVTTSRAASVRRAAHTLKSSAGIFASASTVRAARELESIGENEDLPGVEAALCLLEKNIARLTDELTSRTRTT